MMRMADWFKGGGRKSSGNGQGWRGWALSVSEMTGLGIDPSTLQAQGKPAWPRARVTSWSFSGTPAQSPSSPGTLGPDSPRATARRDLRAATVPGGGRGRGGSRRGRAPLAASGGCGRFRRAPGAAARGGRPLGAWLALVDAAAVAMQLTVKALQGRECSLQMENDCQTTALGPIPSSTWW
ncbi:ubiquitin-like protein 4A isoform X2 [Cavia porcellus]|uniref:ubiquitin-like protein 4A isoform X2 n=1 Tax=Cavia porcellus TaxID=10141 RepID=UPI002FE305B5